MQSDNVFDKEYKTLNLAQKRAVDSIEGPVMVVAGPGTGKTKVLTLRIANILKQTQANPENILALTFTNTASFEMRERLVSIIGDEGYRVNIFTFHAFCEHIIKHFSFYFPEFERFKVIDDLERVHIIENILNKNSFKELISFHDPFAQIRDITSAIQKIKKEGLSPEEFESKIPLWEKDLLSNEEIYYKVNRGKNKKGDIKEAEKVKIEKCIAKAREISKVFSLYQEEIKARGLYDFHDMILLVLRELEKNEHLRSDLEEKFQYILVDEHQDTNDGQNRIVEILTSAPHLESKPNLFTVGDDKQSIYRFQGASTETFAHFKNLFPSVDIINLKENYRSTASILGSAHSLITSTGEKHQELASNKKEDEKISIAEFSNYKFELLYLANSIEKKIKDGMNPKDIAVIFRSNKSGDDIKTVLSNFNIPYTFYSRDSVLSDKNITHIISILKAVLNPNDEESLASCLFINFLGLDPYDSIRISEYANKIGRKTDTKFFGVLSSEEHLKKAGVSEPKPFLSFAEKIKQYKIDSENMDFADFVKHFLEDIGYMRHMLASENNRDMLLRLDKLFDEIKKRQYENKNYRLADFLKSVDSYKKYNLDIPNDMPEIIEGVNIMTAHKSKGREFEAVYILNATRRSWEASRGGSYIALPVYNEFETSIDDERRLFYVSMTRAKKHLSILFSRSNWEGGEEEASEFISEIDPFFTESVDTEKFEKEHIDNIKIFLRPEKNHRNILDKDFLKSIFERRGLNVSALNNYLECPKKYLFRNLLQLPSAYSPALVFGNMIHGALEAFFKDSAREEKILPKKVLLENFKKRIDDSYLYDSEYERFLERGLSALEKYYDHYSKTWNYITEPERTLRKKIALDNGENLLLTGKIDKIEFSDPDKTGDLTIIDYKTGTTYSAKDKNKKADLDRQLVFYRLLLEDFEGDRYHIKNMVLDFIEQNKKGDFERVEKPVTEEDLEDLKHLINEIASEIKSGEFLEKGCGKKDCQYCAM